MGGDNTRTVRLFSPHQPVYIFELFVCFDILLEAKSVSSVSNNHFLASLGKIFRFLNKISEIWRKIVRVAKIPPLTLYGLYICPIWHTYIYIYVTYMTHIWPIYDLCDPYTTHILYMTHIHHWTNLCRIYYRHPILSPWYRVVCFNLRKIVWYLCFLG